MPSTSLLVNSFDLKALGFVVVSAPHWDTPEKEYLTAVIPDRAGEVLVGATPKVKGRQLTIAGVIGGFASPAALRSAMDSLKYKLDAGLLDIRLVDDQTRRYFGYCRQISWEVPTARQFRRKELRCDLRFQMLSPYRSDTTDQSITVLTTDTALPQGTAPVRPALIRLSATVNTVTNPILTYKNSAGVVQQTMDFTGASILSGDKIEINCAAKTIIKTVSGVASDASNLLAGGDFFNFDPQHGDFTTSTWPTLRKASGGTGTLTVLAQYPKQWL